jgi:outer membrane protein assembly factor BamD
MFDLAINAAESTIKLYPSHKEIQFIEYLRCLSYYKQIEKPNKTQYITKQAKSLFEEFINKYPDFSEIDNIKEKLIIINEYLSYSEISIGMFYLEKMDPIAALPRFKNALNYSKVQEPEALYRIVYSCLMMNLVDEANKYYKELSSKFPDNQWTKYASDIIDKQ